ncbi:MAG: tetraacyldisaccharide 4'-kinase [Gammaproteobacteria bacterium]|nr:tetraacyldisaccharide 4'-kinase [Gammaproteobacteria bacterium]
MSHRSGEWLWSKNLLSLSLYPLSLLFCGLTKLRKLAYELGLFHAVKISCPVVVVGNLSVGGNGKTPVVISLISLLKQKGYRPGIVLRGYKSQAEGTISVLQKGEQNSLVGDEANMLSTICECPIAVGLDRPKAAQALSDQDLVDIIISDDGLQHYALARDVEVVVQRQMAMGNGWCLPAGPLREPVSRLKTVDLVVERDQADVIESLSTTWSLSNQDETKELSEFVGQKVHAIAGIGFPSVFFDALRAIGLEVIEHHFQDHYDFVIEDLEFADNLPILMTHKDAVKLQHYQLENSWVVSLKLELSDTIQTKFLKLIQH